MAYEYLKGMGGLGMGDLRDPAAQNQFVTPDRNTSTPPASDPTRASTTKESAVRRATSSSTTDSRASETKASAVRDAASKILLLAVPFGEPLPPTGCVRTDVAIRAELRDWHSIYYSSNGKGALIVGGAHDQKLKADPNFTYMQAATLADYLNAKDVANSMLSGASDSGLTAAQVETIKKWWWKCHKPTYAMMLILRWRSNAMWMPKSIADHYRNYAKSYGWTRECPCPAAAVKTALFGFKNLNSKTVLLSRDASRKTAEARAVADAAQKMVDDNARRAQQAENDAAQARQAAETLKRDMQAQIDQLRQSLSGSVSSDLVTQFQAQIAALTAQMTAAEARALEAEANAAQANSQAVIIEEAAAEVSSGLDPWYLQYKWHLAVVGAAALAGGAYWYMNKQKAAAVPALTKNRLPEPTSARHPSGLRRNAYSSPDQSDSGRPPRNAPRIIWDLFLNMARSARENGGNSPDASIYWSRRGKQWGIGDNFDRYGHFIAKPTGSGEYSLIYRGEWGDEPISRKHALRQARRFFEEGGAADAFRCTMGG